MQWKRWFDAIATLVGLPLTSWLLIAIAFSIRLLDGAPVLFRQKRLGKGKKPFYIYKFRTMKNGQVTAIGRILRSTGLDEIAQIINIVRGEMSVVGPRPLTEADVLRLGWNDSWHIKRWDIQPGITGLAQLYGGHGARVSWLMDEFYRENMSLWMDARILLTTFAVNVFGKARVRRWLFRSSFAQTKVASKPSVNS